MTAADGGIVRPAEWRRVREFVQDAGLTPGLLALLGEAGAGKSTLWRGGVAAAEEAGRRVLRTEASAGEMDMSFAGLSDVLAGVLPDVAAGIPAPQLEALEVALMMRAPGQQPPTAHAVGMAVLAALRACASHGPVLVAIDDVQWLDDASREALAFAFRRIAEGPLSVLIAARTAAAVDPLTVGEPPPPGSWRSLLASVRGQQVLELAPLDMWQIQNLLPQAVTAAQARLVARESRGNPFWAKELAAGLSSDEATVPSLARTLTDRLSQSLSGAATEALAVVAASGRMTLPEALAMLQHLDDPAAAVDAAVVAGVLVETGNRIAVSHPLIGAAAVDAIPPARRAKLYHRLADASPGAERRAHFAALAARPGPDPGVAEALDEAAAAGHARAAKAAAAQFAVQAVGFTPESDTTALVRRRIRAGELLFLAGEVEQSLRQLELLDIDRLDTWELERALPMLLDMADLARGSAAASAMITRAAEGVGADPRRRALVMALASDYAYGIRGRRRQAAIEAIRCAELAGDAAKPALHRALVNLVVAKVFAAEGLDAGLLDRAAGLETDLAAVQLHDTADLHRGIWSGFVDDLDTARAALQRCIARARAAGDDYPLCIFLSYLATVEELAGDFTAAAAVLESERAVAQWHDWPVSPWHVKPRCEMLIAAGDLEGAVRLADAVLPDDDSVPAIYRYMGECVRGKVSVWRGDPEETVRHLENAAMYAEQLEWVEPGLRDRLDPLLAEAYVAVGRTGDAERIATWLRELGDRLKRPVLIGDASRVDAIGAASAGDLDTAAASARAAVAAHEASSMRPALARSLLVLGQIERRRKARKESRSSLRRALELATECRHLPLVAEIERELPRVAAARSRSELTATEQRVAELITSGATNRDVAAALFVSVRTVESHVASIYRKLGVRNRAELTRRLSSPSAR